MRFFYFRGLLLFVVKTRGAEGVHGGTPSKITLYTLRSTCTKYSALIHRVTIKSIRDWTL